MHIPGLDFAIQDKGVPWRSTKHPGIFWFLLGSEPEAPPGSPGPERGSTVLIRMDPGCGYPAHEHLDVEEVLVLAGGYQDAIGEYKAGQYVRYEKGTRHHPIALGNPDVSIGPNNPACLLYANARGGTRVLPGPALDPNSSH